MRFQPLEKLINLHDGYRPQFKIDSLQLLLIQERGELFLFEANCPHRGHPLAQATIVELGQQTGRDAEVIAGLDEHARVIVHPGDTVGDGTRVKQRS